MRRWYWIGLTLLLVAVGVGIGVGAWHAGYNHGLEASGRVHEVVRVVGHGYGFPFGLILFPLFFIGLFLVLRGAAWRRWGGHGPGNDHGPGHRHGPWGGPDRLEEMHRRFHEESWGGSTEQAEGPAGA